MTYVFFIFIIGLHIYSAVVWFLLAKELNNKAKQSFPPILYAILWLIPAINWFILWSTLGDIRDIQKDHKISQFKTFARIWISYILMGFEIGALLSVFITLISVFLNIPWEFVSNVLLFLIPLLAALWFSYELKKLRTIIVIT
jgi:hypothetical protein